MSFEGLLIHTIYKQEAYSSQNNFGEYAYSFSTQTSNGITCRVSPLLGMEIIDTTGKFDNVKYKCFMDDSEDIETGDRIVYGSDIYRIKELTTNSTSHHKTALLTQL